MIGCDCEHVKQLIGSLTFLLELRTSSKQENPQIDYAFRRRLRHLGHADVRVRRREDPKLDFQPHVELPGTAIKQNKAIFSNEAANSS